MRAVRDFRSALWAIAVVLLVCCGSPDSSSIDRAPAQAATRDTGGSQDIDTAIAEEGPFGAECDSLEQAAEADFAKGKRVFAQEGMIELSDFEVFYIAYVQRTYGVQMDARCVITETYWCYDLAMNRRIEEKFGADFEERTRHEAERIFDHQKPANQ